MVAAHPDSRRMVVITYTRKTAPRDWLRVEEWDQISTEALDDGDKMRVQVLSEAIRVYIDGAPISNYLEGHGFSRTTFLRAFNRCITFDSRGRQYGWRGLLPHLRVRPPERRKALIPAGHNGQGGLSGALQLFFNNNEDIRSEFDDYLLKSASRSVGYESKLRQKSAHQKFISLCSKKSIPNYEWPFNTKTQGKGAIRAYVERFIHARYDDIVSTQFGQKAKAKSNTGTGYTSRLTATRPLDIVELDEHKCHFIGSIGIQVGDITRWLPLQRVTIIVCADRSSGTILGYQAIFRREANSEDVLDAINAAFGKRNKHIFSEGMAYAPNAGFPSDLGAPFDWCGFNQLLLDNALAHIAMPVIERVADIAGCDINFGPIRRFERRPIIERIFGELEGAGFHRINSTTGSGTDDPLRQDPEIAATAAKLSLADALDLIEAVIADHNGKVSKRNFGARRLGRLQSLAKDDDGLGMIFPVLPPLLPGTAGLHLSIVPKVVRGNQEKGRRPHIYFEEEEYFGTDLSNRWDLLGKQLYAHVDRSDIRQFDLFDRAGVKVDSVRVRGHWRHSPHSRDKRKQINDDIRSGYLKVGFDEDPVNAHNAALAARLGQGKGGNGKSATSATNALAEEQRIRANASSKTVQECLRNVFHQVDDDGDDSVGEDGFLSLNDLGAINRADQ